MVVTMEIEINDYEFPTIEYKGNTVHGRADAIVSYHLEVESWEYPIASAGTRYEDSVKIQSFELCISVADDGGDLIYETDEDVPNDLRKIYYLLFKEVVEDLVSERL